MVNDRQNLDLTAFARAPGGTAVEWLISDQPIPYPEAIARMESRVADIVSVPCPPAAGKTVGVAAAVTWHFWADGATTEVEVSVDVQAADPANTASRNAISE